MILLVCLLTLMVYFDIRYSRISNKWIMFLLFIALSLKWKEGGNKGVLEGALGFLAVLMILLPIFALRVLGAADVKIFLALSVYLPFGAIVFVMLCSLCLGSLLGLIYLGFASKKKVPIFMSIIGVKNPTAIKAVHERCGLEASNLKNLKFHYIHFTVPIFISFVMYAYGGVYELLLRYL